MAKNIAVNFHKDFLFDTQQQFLKKQIYYFWLIWWWIKFLL